MEVSGIKKICKNRCLGINKNGVRCLRLVTDGHCFQHKTTTVHNCSSSGKKVESKECIPQPVLIEETQLAKKFDQYYTKGNISKLCVASYCQSVVIDKNLDLIIEPSAGEGSIYNVVSAHANNTIGMDLYPKQANIILGDFLKFKVPNNSYRIIHVIGNPPFNQLALFIKKASEIGDFIGFILPLSFKKDSLQKKFPLNFNCIFSKELPKNSFTFCGKTKNVSSVFQI